MLVEVKAEASKKQLHLDSGEEDCANEDDPEWDGDQMSQEWENSDNHSYVRPHKKGYKKKRVKGSEKPVSPQKKPERREEKRQKRTFRPETDGNYFASKTSISTSAISSSATSSSLDKATSHTLRELAAAGEQLLLAEKKRALEGKQEQKKAQEVHHPDPPLERKRKG